MLHVTGDQPLTPSPTRRCKSAALSRARLKVEGVSGPAHFLWGLTEGKYRWLKLLLRRCQPKSLALAARLPQPQLKRAWSHVSVCLPQGGDGEMDAASLSGAGAPGRPVDLLLC